MINQPIKKNLKKTNLDNYKQYSMYILFIFLGALIGWYARITNSAYSIPIKISEIRDSIPGDKLINPLIYIDVPQKSPGLEPLAKEIKKSVDSFTNNSVADSVSVYYRDLNNSQWTGVNENDSYTPSSMLKIMVMMSYLIQADYNPAILQKTFPYQATTDSGQYYKPEHVLSAGSHSVQELINSMIINSDNNAAEILTNNNKAGYAGLYNTLQIPTPLNSDGIDFMSPKFVSVLFRTLYNADYLSHDLSEKALELLTQTTFKRGLVAGVPSNVVVAHKFGEHTEQYTDGTVVWHELHDCGIIYQPDHPYLLCIMTKGKDFNKLESVISTISSTVYKKTITN